MFELQQYQLLWDPPPQGEAAVWRQGSCPAGHHDYKQCAGVERQLCAVGRRSGGGGGNAVSSSSSRRPDNCRQLPPPSLLLCPFAGEDVKCLVAWGDGVVVIAFRGTASLANVKSDLQVGCGWEAGCVQEGHVVEGRAAAAGWEG